MKICRCGWALLKQEGGKKIGKEVCENKCGWTRGHGGSGRGKNENLRNENIKPLNLKNMKR